MKRLDPITTPRIVDLPPDHRFAKAADHAVYVSQVVDRQAATDLTPVDPASLPPDEVARMRADLERAEAAAPRVPDWLLHDLTAC